MTGFNVSGSSQEPISTTPVQPSSANPTIAGQAAQAGKTTKKDFSLDTEINSLAELKEAAPEVYKRMMEGVAYGIISKMRKSQERLKKMWREGNSPS